MEEEVITLSSDEDCESPKSSETSALKNTEINVCINLLKEKLHQNMFSMKNTKKHDNMKLKVIREKEKCSTCPTPEVVDLVDCPEKSPENGYSVDTRKGETIKNHSRANGTDADVRPTYRNALFKDYLDNKATNDKSSNFEKLLVEIEAGEKISTSEIPQASSKSQNDVALGKNNVTDDNCNAVFQDTKNQSSNKNLNIFAEFLDHCVSLEENPKDREKLLEKLNKHHAGARPEYVRSKEFRNLIIKCKDKINANNLYVVAKTITDELKLRKNIENCLKDESATVKEQSQTEGETNECFSPQRQQKRFAKIQKIIKKLNQLGHAIRELEKQEVDLSDEEDSVYLKLQRFRERFWMIYKKLCEITSDLDIRIFDEKIHFTETKYPAINKCIEKWLNKTKSFPDFADVLKILESHSTELNLPSDRESLRSTAIEIFQKVGEVLQRKRKYDLWNGLSEFLEDTEDPAVKDLKLEKIFKENYEIRVKKEQEIYQFYAERQEKESLQPKEVSEVDANLSPESGNEEEEEIINIEKSLEQRLFDSVSVADRDKQASDDVKPKNANSSLKEKESKNNFKNCKSLKWRSEKGGTSKSESSDDSAAEIGIDNGEKTTAEEQEENHSSPELILVEPDSQTDVDAPTVHRFSLSPMCTPSFKKRSLPSGNENGWMKRKSLKKEDVRNFVGYRNDVENLSKLPVFDVGYCQVVTNYYKERRKVFRDLTNLNRLMKKPGLMDKVAGLFTPTFLYGRYSLKKEAPWKKRFKINLREIKPKNQKCALNEEEKTGEKVRSTSSRNSEAKESADNGDDGRQGADFSGQGNGQEEDNNGKGDENRKNGKVEDENDDSEEDDDEEKEDENAEADEHSSNKQKTEKEKEDLLEPTSNENHTLDDAETTLITENNETYLEEGATGEDSDQQNKEEEEGKSEQRVDEILDNSIDYYDESGGDIAIKCKDSEDVEEFENLKNSLEPICVLKEGDASDVIGKANDENPLDVFRKSEEDNAWIEKLKEKEKFRSGPFTRSKLRARMGERSRNETQNQKRLPVTAAWTPPSEVSQAKPRKMSASDEERVKRFLMHSPSSISITPPRKLTLSKPPSQSALQALATLRNLKGISATIVKAKPKKEDVKMAGGQSKRPTDQSAPVAAKRRRPDLPVISNVQSVKTLTPKIVTVQGNVSGFDNLWPEMKNNGNAESDSSSIKISKVWGSLPMTVGEANSSHHPGCSSRKSNPGTSNQIRKKNPKKQVEYVVLD